MVLKLMGRVEVLKLKLKLNNHKLANTFKPCGVKVKVKVKVNEMVR